MSIRTMDCRSELLVDQALEGLTPEERVELDQLLAGEEDLSFERAAAAVDVATMAHAEALPSHLAAKIEADALRSLRGPSEAAPGARVIAWPAPGRRDFTRWAGWVAAAASFALAAGAWLTRPRPPGAIAVVAPPAVSAVASVEAPPPRPTLAQLRDEVARSQDAVRVEWTATKDPAARDATGDVVWSESLHRGFMRFRGLAPNDPTRAQYQLWILRSQSGRKDSHRRRRFRYRLG